MKQGLVLKSDYDSLLASGFFRDLQRDSDQFNFENASLITGYEQKWVANPFRQWSRQWEYPFVYSALQNFLHERSSGQPLQRVLDAGAGFTFLPFTIANQCPLADVVCLDQDRYLESLYSNNRRNFSHVPRFQCGSLDQLPLQDNSVDFLYCISVLEHTRNYTEILHEFRRVLVPGGQFVLTFDLSLDGRSDIPLEEAHRLLGKIHELFDCSVDEVTLPNSVEELAASGCITTSDFKGQPDLLPWKHPRLAEAYASLRSGRMPAFRMKSLTVACFSVRKPAD